VTDWKEFFRLHGEESVALYFYGKVGHLSLEELYQAFKARMEQEAREAAHPNEGCPARYGPASGCVC
jgi:hypothetical protein